jgi:hypothetical protein
MSTIFIGRSNAEELECSEIPKSADPASRAVGLNVRMPGCQKKLTEKQRIVPWLKPRADDAYPLPRIPFPILQTTSFAHVRFLQGTFPCNKHQDMGQSSTRRPGTLLIDRQRVKKYRKVLVLCPTCAAYKHGWAVWPQTWGRGGRHLSKMRGRW